MACAQPQHSVTLAGDRKDAPKDRAHFTIEATNLSGVLISVKYRLEED
jgi:hypothetical protein